MAPKISWGHVDDIPLTLPRPAARPSRQFVTQLSEPAPDTRRHAVENVSEPSRTALQQYTVPQQQQQQQYVWEVWPVVGSQVRLFKVITVCWCDLTLQCRLNLNLQFGIGNLSLFGKIYVWF